MFKESVTLTFTDHALQLTVVHGYSRGVPAYTWKMKGNVPVITDVEMTSDDFTRHLRGDILTTVQQLVSIMLWGSWRYGSRHHSLFSRLLLNKFKFRRLLTKEYSYPPVKVIVILGSGYFKSFSNRSLKVSALYSAPPQHPRMCTGFNVPAGDSDSFDRISRTHSALDLPTEHSH
ncbi:hypothetical protein KGM_210618 [Danaus plexippus plexippus]|uniref:Uncharacterized protein n=1 Tax=Danaus plexippus plexippus TaxID=278856 RepID=A0A212FH57_DANPL|nr:hypothetical protein KGM_210618 [Danaus plexippus plexippus]